MDTIMRQKKIRGHLRRQKQIETWLAENQSWNLQRYFQSGQDFCYVKIAVHPWNGLSVTKSILPEPRGKTKQKMLSGLFDIYENWKRKLDRFGKPYYLKIWLFEPRFSQSQVVCAVGDSIDHYENLFFTPASHKKLNANHYGPLKTRVEGFDWKYRPDEYVVEDPETDSPEEYADLRKYREAIHRFEKQLKKPHRTWEYGGTPGEATRLYAFKCGDMWLGEAR
jgi:hypothetical protein